METIACALGTHKEWLVKFQARVGGGEPITFDPEKIRYADSCKLGHWLKSSMAINLMGPEAQRLASSMHETFHELAFNAATISKACGDMGELNELLNSLRQLSDQMAQLLNVHRKWYIA